MIVLKSMSADEFEEFKAFSQDSFASNLAKTEGVSIEAGRKNAGDQFARLVPSGMGTAGQLFFEAVEDSSGNSVGYLWIGIQERFGRKIASINDIHVRNGNRGNGYGREIMRLAEEVAKREGVSRIRLHVFQSNQVARTLYESLGFKPTSIDMNKEL